MNRIQLLERQLNDPHSQEVAAAEFNPFVVEPDHYAEHRFFAPMHYEKNYAYPLIVWLHGQDGHERELHEVMRHVSLRNYVGLSVRGTRPSQSAELVGQFGWRQSSAEIARAADTVEDCIALATKRFNIAAERIFLVGFDSGGTMALRLGLNAPEHFAGVASLGGVFPRTHHPLRYINRARRLPLMMAYGSESETCGDQQVCDDLRLLHSAGMSVAIRRYPCPQEVTTEMLADVNRWAMEVINGTSAQTAVNHARSEPSN